MGNIRTQTSSKTSEMAKPSRAGYDRSQYLSWVPSQPAEKWVWHWKAMRNRNATIQAAVTTSDAMMMMEMVALRPDTQKMRL